MSNIQRRIDIVVSGQVQGVFFRQGVKTIAEKLEVYGWARNAPDGSVKIVAEGSEEGLKKLVEWCKKGRGSVRVDTIEVNWIDATGEFNSFVIR